MRTTNYGTRFAGAMRIRTGSAARNTWMKRVDSMAIARGPTSSISFKPGVGAGVGDGVGAVAQHV